MFSLDRYHFISGDASLSQMCWGKCCYTLLLQKGMAIFRTCYPTNITSRNSPQIWWVIILLVAAITPNSFPGPSHFCVITTTNYDSTQICSRMFTETFLIDYMFHNYILLLVKYQNRYVIDSFLQKIHCLPEDKMVST